MSKTTMHNSEAMSNHVRELTNQANELTTDELEHVSGGINLRPHRMDIHPPKGVLTEKDHEQDHDAQFQSQL